jgi:anti-sigma-K factor RskA
MSDALPPTGPEPDVTAAELALGLLDGEDRAQALRRVLAEPGFAAEVEAWRGRFADLFDAWPEAEAPADGLPRLDRVLDPAQPAAIPRGATGRLWPGLAAASSLIAACLLLFVLLRPSLTPLAPVAPQPARSANAPMLMAAIMPSEGGAPAAAMYDPSSGKFSMAAAPMGKPGHSAQLWMIGADGVPHSLGLMHPHAPTEMMLPPETRAHMADGVMIAVSLEPMGGSPTGLPTGPVIAKGALSLA